MVLLDQVQEAPCMLVPFGYGPIGPELSTLIGIPRLRIRQMTYSDDVVVYVCVET